MLTDDDDNDDDDDDDDDDALFSRARNGPSTKTHRLAVYDVHKRCIRETVQLLDNAPVRTSFYWSPAGDAGGVAGTPTRRGWSSTTSSQQVQRRRQARNTFENSFRVFCSTSSRTALGSGDLGGGLLGHGGGGASGGSDGGGGRTGSGDGVASDGDPAAAGRATTTTVQHTLYMLSSQRLRCVRAQDWDAKVRTLLQSTMVVADPARGIGVDGNDDDGGDDGDDRRGEDLVLTAVQRGAALHFAWAEALAIAATHYERHNKHDNEFSQARMELLALARRYTRQHIQSSAETLAAVERSRASQSAATNDSDGVDAQADEDTTTTTSGDGDDEATNKPKPNDGKVVGEVGTAAAAAADDDDDEAAAAAAAALTALAQSHEAFARNVIDFCCVVDMSAKLFSDIFPLLQQSVAAAMVIAETRGAAIRRRHSSSSSSSNRTSGAAAAAAAPVGGHGNGTGRPDVAVSEMDLLAAAESPACLAFTKYLIFSKVGR